MVVLAAIRTEKAREGQEMVAHRQAPREKRGERTLGSASVAFPAGKAASLLWSGLCLPERSFQTQEMWFDKGHTCYFRGERSEGHILGS